MASHSRPANVPPLLVIDDEPAVAEVTRRHLVARFPDLKVLACCDPETAMQLVATTEFSVVMCDFAMPVHNGIEILAEARRRNPYTVGILITGQATKETVIEAINYAQVWKIVEKPWREEALIGWVREAVEVYRSRAVTRESTAKVRRDASPLVRRPTPVIRLRMPARSSVPPVSVAGRSRSTFAPPIPLPKVGPRFKDLQLLNADGIGTVYRAHDTIEGRDVALKVLAARFTSDEAAVTRLEADIRMATRLSHRSVVRPQRIERSLPATVVTMELIHGTTLRSVLARYGRVQEPAVLEIVETCANALEESNTVGLLHLQLRPELLMLDRERRLKILGFGQRELTRFSLRDGAPRYWFHLAPELASGQSDDLRADIFSLGILAHELLCGHVPDHAGEERPNGPAEYRPTASEELTEPVRKVLEQAFAVRPCDRFSRATEFAGALRRALAT